MAGTLLVTGGEAPSSGSVPTTAGLAVRIAIGAGLVAFGLYRRARIGKPPRKPKKEPGWQKSIDNMSLWFAALLAPITQPWGLMAAGVTSVMEADVSSAASVAMLVVFVVLASSTYLALLVFALIRRDRAHVVALSIRTWIEGHLQQALAYGSLLVGLFLMGSGTYQLIT